MENWNPERFPTSQGGARPVAKGRIEKWGTPCHFKGISSGGSWWVLPLTRIASAAVEAVRPVWSGGFFFVVLPPVPFGMCPPSVEKSAWARSVLFPGLELLRCQRVILGSSAARPLLYLYDVANSSVPLCCATCFLELRCG
ncbi:hypothetical protein, unlikely [Trypanosoma brucei gambiense DAL972]|uniref:Uncharacterized protein n=1 Tax=Trypanosoma brucei gambiense (strain MHOM/CI/86/DAL972) TaxID=679716 RepID=D0A1S4_TRYB9|nr:hypothetical protein, unlikely [Trypanosoma brucei gambiense DAL972]CBH15217.1 hypothetical protein, unlikely [Trypanosoma brucei gambiense DAL972]|eukprot:XP_011777482.1 hypothetical protein, unlikely [Trypanosoma brucei gambiense DAL972]